MATISSSTDQVVSAQTLISGISGAAVNSSEFKVLDDKMMTIFSDEGISGETVKLQIKKPDNTWIDCYADGSLIALTGTNNTLSLYGKGIYRISMASTAAVIGVYAYNISFK